MYEICDKCGEPEHFNLLDSEHTGDNPEPTGRLLCIKCFDPNDPAGPWEVQFSLDDIKKSVRVDLKPYYRRYLRRERWYAIRRWFTRLHWRFRL